MTQRNVCIALAAAMVALGATTAVADGNRNGNGNANGNGDAGDRTFSTKLIGYNETPLTINSSASGNFTGTLSSDGTSLQYTLTYQDLSSQVQQAHIHFGRPAITGQIVLFLCTNLGNAPGTVPTPQACPQSGTITGTLTAADVIARATQGIDSGATGFAEMIKAMHAGAAYANVHSANFPGGEIRGALKAGDDGQDANDDND